MATERALKDKKGVSCFWIHAVTTDGFHHFFERPPVNAVNESERTGAADPSPKKLPTKVGKTKWPAKHGRRKPAGKNGLNKFNKVRNS